MGQRLMLIVGNQLVIGCSWIIARRRKIAREPGKTVGLAYRVGVVLEAETGCNGQIR